jgi:uncharacterized membrane protein HdeD (DUF308 family)
MAEPHRDLSFSNHWKVLLTVGLLLEAIGLLAFIMPFWSTLAVTILIGWLFFIGGASRLLMLFRANRVLGHAWPGYWWSLISAVLSIGIGLLLALNPLPGMFSLTIVLTALFLVEGVAAILASLDFRHHTRHWVWMLFSGMINVLLVALIFAEWPVSATWLIGMLAGINLVLAGFPLVVLALATRFGSHRR